MGQLQDAQTIRKLLDMLRYMPFLKMNLSNNISENSAYLKDYLLKMSLSDIPIVEIDSYLLDISFGLAVILDTETCMITALNKFATNLFMMVLSGTSKEKIAGLLEPLKQYNPEILMEFESLMRLIEERNYYSMSMEQYPEIKFLPEYAAKSGYKISALEYQKLVIKELL